MYLDPLDIACYIYCPVLYKKRRSDKIVGKLTVVEENIRQAFIDAEQRACLKDSIVSPKRLLAEWDNLWWPAAASAGINMTEASKVSLKASSKFADYCKYDISDWMFPTAGVQAESETHINSSILRATTDIVKVDLNGDRNTVLVNFNKRKLSIVEAAYDPAIKATAYAFYSGRGEIITHIAIDIDEKKQNLKLTTSIFRPESMEEIRKMLYHVECGIRYSRYYPNPYACQECNICQNFIS
jgi:hypothetical protein